MKQQSKWRFLILIGLLGISGLVQPALADIDPPVSTFTDDLHLYNSQFSSTGYWSVSDSCAGKSTTTSNTVIGTAVKYDFSQCRDRDFEISQNVRYPNYLSSNPFTFQIHVRNYDYESAFWARAFIKVYYMNGGSQTITGENTRFYRNENNYSWKLLKASLIPSSSIDQITVGIIISTSTGWEEMVLDEAELSLHDEGFDRGKSSSSLGYDLYDAMQRVSVNLLHVEDDNDPNFREAMIQITGGVHNDVWWNFSSFDYRGGIEYLEVSVTAINKQSGDILAFIDSEQMIASNNLQLLGGQPSPGQQLVNFGAATVNLIGGMLFGTKYSVLSYISGTAEMLNFGYANADEDPNSGNTIKTRVDPGNNLDVIVTNDIVFGSTFLTKFVRGSGSIEFEIKVKSMVSIYKLAGWGSTYLRGQDTLENTIRVTLDR